MTTPADSLFGFPRKERSPGFRYNRHFIRVVNLICHYDEVTDVKQHESTIRKFVPDNFTRDPELVFRNLNLSIFTKEGQPTVQHDVVSAGVAFLPPDKRSILALFNDALRYDVTGASYNNFDSYISDVDIPNILKTLGVDIVKDLTFTKSNWIEFNDTNDGLRAYDHFEFLLGPDIAAPLKKIPSQDWIKSHNQTTQYQKDHFVMKIVFGLISPSHKSRGRLTFDVQIKHTAPILTSELISVIKRMNDEIFNVFHWAATDELIALLDTTE